VISLFTVVLDEAKCHAYSHVYACNATLSFVPFSHYYISWTKEDTKKKSKKRKEKSY
jgi:hypothetical protein